MYNSQSRATSAGKNDTYCAAVGGFVVAQMPDGKFDYFPQGQPPHIVEQGQVKKCGTIVAQFHYNPNGRTWKKD